MSDPRNFKSSKVNIKNAFAEKEANDKARVLDINYKVKVTELKQAREDISKLANKYLLKFDFTEVITKFEEINIQSVINEINDLMIRGGEKKMLDLSHYKNAAYKFRPFDVSEETDVLRTTLQSKLVEMSVLEQETGLTLQELVEVIPEIKAALDKFLDTYSDILGMDPRPEADKVKGYEEYAQTILDKVKAGNVTEAAKAVINSAGRTIEDSANTVIEAAIHNVVTSAVASIWSYSASFFTKPADPFFNDMPSIDPVKLSQAVFENELSVHDQSRVDEAIAENAEESKLELAKAVKLSDGAYSDAVHKNNQAEVYNIIEVAKAQCFEGSYAMQKYVIQNCKAKGKLTDSLKCAQFNKMADLAVKNCDTIFPMETKYDAILDASLMQSINEMAIISEAGDILHIGAGEVVSNQARYIPQITAVEVSANGGGDQLLLGQSNMFSDSTELVLLDLNITN